MPRHFEDEFPFFIGERGTRQIFLKQNGINLFINRNIYNDAIISQLSRAALHGKNGLVAAVSAEYKNYERVRDET